MTTTFPTSIQDLDATRGTDTNPLSTPNHVTHHTTEDDTIEALQTKVGVDNSVVTTSLDYIVKNASSNGGGHVQTPTTGGTGITTYVKGDIVTGTGTNTVGKLAVGTNGYKMVADSTQANGMKWTPDTGKFGGDGSDGALSVSGGTTNIDLGGSAFVVKNYTSISITSTGTVTFSNPHADGTVVILKSQGNVTLTSSSTPMVGVVGLGAQGGTSVNRSSAGNTTGNNGSNGATITNWDTSAGNNSGGGGGGAGGSTISYVSTYPQTNIEYLAKYQTLFIGAGGASGSCNWISGSAAGTVTSGSGGRGGGGLIIECGGAFNFTTTNGISVAGAPGGNGDSGTTTRGDGSGGGGGGAGFFLCLYNSLTSNSGSVVVTGGAGGTGAHNQTDGAFSGLGGGGGGGSMNAGSTGGAGTTGAAANGGNGGQGLSYIGANTEFF